MAAVILVSAAAPFGQIMTNGDGATVKHLAADETGLNALYALAYWEAWLLPADIAPALACRSGIRDEVDRPSSLDSRHNGIRPNPWYARACHRRLREGGISKVRRLHAPRSVSATLRVGQCFTKVRSSTVRSPSLHSKCRLKLAMRASGREPPR